MELVKTKEQVIDNIITLEKYLKSKSPIKKEFALNLVKQGETIVVYKINNENHFAPSRFVGYIGNDMDKHILNEEKSGLDTNPVIDKIIGHSFSNQKIEKGFIDYCAKLGLDIPNNNRHHWRLKDARGKNLNI